MLKRFSLKFKPKAKDKNGKPGGPPGAAVPYDPDIERHKKESSIESWTPEGRLPSNGHASLPSVKAPEGGRKLTEAVSKGDMVELRRLVSDGADINARDVHGNTALHCAAHLGKSKIIRYLLLHGADIEAKTKESSSSLEVALGGGHTGSVGVLLDYMHSVDNRPRKPFILVRGRKTGTNQHRIERFTSCIDIHPFQENGVDQIHLFIAHGQRAADMAVFLYSVLDVSVCHAFFLNTIGDLNMRNFQRFETKTKSESVTVLNTNILTMDTAGYESLRSLILVSCGLTKISLDGGLERLELLDLSHNRIETLGESLSLCVHLKTLRVSHNRLRRLPEAINSLQRLTVLEANHNSLRWLTTHLIQCRSLRVLHVGHNELQQLPVDVGLLANLEELVVSYNKLAQLPLSICSLERLQIVEFRANPLTNIPRDFPERPTEVREYLRSLRDDPVPNRVVKLVLVGQEGVGKTTLLTALKRHIWILPRTPPTDKTEGVEVKDLQLEELTFKCFDCGGDVDFNDTHRFFITPGALVLACFNLSEYTRATVERGSFLLGRLQLWLQYIFSKVPAARVIIVGSHADSSTLKKQVLEEIWELLRTMLVSARDHHRQYFSSHDRLADCLLCQSDSKCLRRSTEEGSAGYVNLGCSSADSDEDETSFNDDPSRIVALPHIVGYYEVSSVRAMGNTSLFQVASNQSIEQLKEAILDAGRRLTSANPDIPRKWANAYESLQNHAGLGADSCITNLTEVGRIAGVHGVRDGQDLTNMLHFLKAQGHLLFFPQAAEKQLTDLVILDPEWLARMFATVVSYRETVVGDDGFVERKRLLSMWQAAGYGVMGERLLGLLHYFGVCMPVVDTGMEVFPSRLPIGMPEERIWSICPGMSEKQVTYSVTFPSIVPPPLFGELIVAVYQGRVAVTCNEESSRYFANLIVENFRLNQVGCPVCQQGARGPPAYLEEDDKVHQVLLELVPHKRCVQVTVRGAQPCCMSRQMSELLNSVVSKYEGLGTIELDTVICPGCYMQCRKAPHRFSIKQMLADCSSREELNCCHGHKLPSSTSLLRGIVDDSCMPYMTIKARSSTDRQNYAGCPRLFIMLPVNRDGLTFNSTDKMYASSLLFDGFAVHFVCEFPDGYHLTNAPGYRLKDPATFASIYGDHVIAVLRLLGHLTDSSVVSLTSHARAISKTIDKLINDLLMRFPQIKDTSSTCTAQQLVIALSERGKMFSRQELRNCLHVVDQPGSFGPLRRLKMSDQTLWVCNEHYRQLRILRVGLKDIEQLDEDSKV